MVVCVGAILYGCMSVRHCVVVCVGAILYWLDAFNTKMTKTEMQMLAAFTAVHLPALKEWCQQTLQCVSHAIKFLLLQSLGSEDILLQTKIMASQVLVGL
jgi:hypothetical protein